MADTSFLRWPFFTDHHRAFADELERWCANELQGPAHSKDVGASCRSLVQQLGQAGWLQHAVANARDGAQTELDVRTLCLARETLARHHPLADFAFAMQGLGAGPISLFGNATARQRWLPGVASGSVIAAFALSEPAAGSDLAAMQTAARRVEHGWRLDGEKTWISNGGIADFYVVFARVPEGGERCFAAFVVPKEAVGLSIAETLEVTAPHPLARLQFSGCVVDDASLLGGVGDGLRIALGTLDVFRSTVGAAALGMARRALDEAARYTLERRVGGEALADHQMTQSRLAHMAVDVDASALLVYRAAWTRDVEQRRVTREAAMAKWSATEAAQRVVDSAVQLLGGRGVLVPGIVEQLYREVRSLRIYEGTSEIQQLVIARQLLDQYRSPEA